MTRNYAFEWYETKTARYGNPDVRHTLISLSNPSGKTEFDAKRAVEIFTAKNGNLKKNTIICIKEMDENGQIGEDIVPQEDSSIVPVGK